MYEYKCFISYSRADAKLAKKIQSSLENFKLRTPEGSKLKFGNVYLDITEHRAETNLAHSIRKALMSSETLLVLCTKNSVRSQWVAREIEAFCQSRFGDHQVFLIGSRGEVQSAKIETLVPRALADAIGQSYDEFEVNLPTIVDLDEDGIRKASARIVAGILDIDFEFIWKRRQRLHAARFLRNTLVATIFLLLILGATILNKVSSAENTTTKVRAFLKDEHEMGLGNARDSRAQISRSGALRLATFASRPRFYWKPKVEDISSLVTTAADNREILSFGGSQVYSYIVDNNRIFAIVGSSLEVWSILERRLQTRVDLSFATELGPMESVRLIRFSPDNFYLSTSRNEILKINQSGLVISRVKLPTASVPESIVWIDGDLYFQSGSSRIVRVSGDRLQLEQEWYFPRQTIKNFEVQGGYLVVIGRDGHVYAQGIDDESGNEPLKSLELEEVVGTNCLSTICHFFSTSGIVYIVDLEPMKIIGEIETGVSDLWLLRSLPEEKQVALFGLDGQVSIYDLDENRVKRRLHLNRSDFVDAKFLPDNDTFFLALSNGAIVHQNVKIGITLPIENATQSPMSRRQFSLDGRTFISLDDDRNLHVWSLDPVESGLPIFQSKRRFLHIFSIVDGQRLFSVDAYGDVFELKFFNAINDIHFAKVAETKGTVLDAGGCSSSIWVLKAPGILSILNTRHTEGSPIPFRSFDLEYHSALKGDFDCMGDTFAYSLQADTSLPFGRRYSKDGSPEISGGQLRFLNLKNNSSEVVSVHSGRINDVRYNDSYDLWITVGYDNRVCATNRSKKATSCADISSPIIDLTLSSNGQFIGVAAANKAAVFSLPNLELIGEIKSPNSKWRKVSISNDGLLLFVTSSSGGVSIWNAASKTKLASTLKGHNVSDLKFLDKPRLLLIGTNDGQMLAVRVSEFYLCTLDHPSICDNGELLFDRLCGSNGVLSNSDLSILKETEAAQLFDMSGENVSNVCN